jgi:drug/metabolite transporter (DMT)-like permease
MIHHLIAACSFGILPVLYKSLLMTDIDSITILIITKLIIALFTISLIFFGNNYEIVKNDFNILFKSSYNKCYYVAILFITAAFVYLYGQYSYIIVFKNTETNISTIVISCYPIITILLSYFYFNETINLYQFIGIILIFTGLALITTKLK